MFDVRDRHGIHLPWESVAVGDTVRILTAVDDRQDNDGAHLWYGPPRTVYGKATYGNGAVFLRWHEAGKPEQVGFTLLTTSDLRFCPLVRRSDEA